MFDTWSYQMSIRPTWPSRHDGRGIWCCPEVGALSRGEVNVLVREFQESAAEHEEV
jgi:hypothetical protein